MWKCIYCDDPMCDSCKFMHLRNRQTKQHIVIALREIDAKSLKQQAKLDTTYCLSHPSEALIMYCVDCETLACKECNVSGIHRKHVLVKLFEIAEQKRREMTKHISDSKKKLSGYHQTITDIQKYQNDYAREIQILIENVKERGQMLQDEIGNIVKSLIVELEHVKGDDLRHLKKMQGEVKDEIESMKEFISSCEERNSILLKDAAIVRNSIDVRQEINQFRTFPPPNSVQPPIYFPGSIEHDQLVMAMGKVFRDTTIFDKKPEEVENNPKNFDNMHSVDIGGEVDVIAAVKKEFWVGLRGLSNNLSLITSNGHIRVQATLPSPVYGMAMNNIGELFVTENGGHYVKKMTQDGQFETIMDTMPFQTRGLCTTSENELLLCLFRETYQKGKIMRISEKGDIKQNIEFTEQKEKIFSHPNDIAQNVDGTICVVDDYSTMIAVNKEGDECFKYTGPQGIKMDNDVFLTGIVCDKMANILLSDYNNQQIHQLDKNGQFVRFLINPKFGLHSPAGLSINRKGQLFVCNSRNVLILSYLKKSDLSNE